MSNRIVALGPHVIGTGESSDLVKVLDISPMDAGALVASKKWRVSLSLFSGSLSDATVITRTEGPVSDGDWESLKLICCRQQESEIEVPIPLYERNPS